ncbi:glycosyltransferase, family 2 [Treponema primitia ZAS-2]|uniref:Glycosyltransferase, family 2 n=1 Tax=Treponema primitia (strain ATCC BAA-887 / DSM 12427 / ZAS-2) TaxID=545694 RepID=F5YMC2_TREPZ|nr:glycosyltransferase [Treponema primitia]AEF86656.1 glycosyltransferase, family 2 [Treponema primitia ZAS-2]
MPLVSVIMPVYNAEIFVRETIDSILNQTFHDFEFIIIDDASSDSSPDIIKSYNDPRIRFYKNEKNIGYVANLNRMIDLAQGKFIARQDNDDISHPDRLKKQVAFLQKYENVGVCGSYVQLIGTKKGLFKRPIRDKDIRARLLFFCPMVHPSVMMRASLFKQGIKYDEELSPAEDYNLWFEISKMTKIANIPRVLLYYRLHDNSVSNLKQDIQTNISDAIRHKIIEYSLSIRLTEEEKRVHDLVVRPHTISYNDLILLQEWLMHLQALSIKSNYYNTKAVKNAIFEAWSGVCRNNSIINPFQMLCFYYNSTFFNMHKIFIIQSLKTTIKILFKMVKNI